MKALILAGGAGTRLSPPGAGSPKPLTEIGGRPILWHVMKIYASHGISEFIVCLGGHAAHAIRTWFANSVDQSSDVRFNDAEGTVDIAFPDVERWDVKLVDTGDTTATAGRVKRALRFVSDAMFCLTYCDGLSDVNISTLVATHEQAGATVTLTAVQVDARFGVIELRNGRVREFREKPKSWVNGGFFVCSPDVDNFIVGDADSWEYDVLPKIAGSGLLAAYEHDGFWQSMDTPQERDKLEELWRSGEAPWRSWRV